MLPLKYLSESDEYRHLSQGFSEDLIIDLSRFDALHIISNHTTQDLKEDDQEALKGLEVDYLVSGSFRHFGDNVRINTQLIRFEDNSLVWADRFDEDISNIFNIQDEIIEKIVSSLQQRIEINLLEGSIQKDKTNLQAYTNYLLGMKKLREGSVEADMEARNYFEKALENDPNYSRAISGLSLTYFNEWSCQLWDRWDISQKGAHDYAEKAVEVNENDYVALTVLGITNLYLRDYEKSEHFLRKSLRINPNDADNLIQIASCMAYLGYKSEAVSLLEKALRLNPLNRDWYNGIGSFIYYEVGDFEKSIELGVKAPVNQTFIDLSAFIAAAFFETSQEEMMRKYWKQYLQIFKTKINGGEEASSEEAARWMLSVNPYKDNSHLKKFLDHITEQSIDTKEQTRTQQPRSSFIFTNGIWKIIFDHHEISLPDSKGLQDIAALLKKPFQEISCLELMGAVQDEEGVELIDQKAREEIKAKINSLSEDIEEADSMQDSERSAQLREEYDQLVDHLSGSLGLGGKSRKTGATAERARTAIAWRIKSALKKIEKTHPSLARHLSNSIKTGTACSYKPESSPDWKF